MTAEELEYYFLVGVLIFIGICFIFSLVRAIAGPRVADRIVAINMTNTLTVMAIAVLSVMLGEGYLGDVCLIYVMLGFLAVAVLCKIFITVWLKQNKNGGGDGND